MSTSSPASHESAAGSMRAARGNRSAEPHSQLAGDRVLIRQRLADQRGSIGRSAGAPPAGGRRVDPDNSSTRPSPTEASVSVSTASRYCPDYASEVELKPTRLDGELHGL